MNRLAARLGVRVRELVWLAAILVAATLARFVNLPVRGGWDSDQGTEMLAMRAALHGGGLPTFGPEAISVGGTFHHGALYYDLLLPAAWIGNGDPTVVVAEIALLSLLVVPIVWWMARSMGGEAAGVAAGLLAAVSGALIGYSTFIWNPTLVEPAAAVAFLGAWQAWRTRRPAWWLVAAAGSAVAMQSHIAAAVLILPMAVVFLAAVRRGPAQSRRRLIAWGIAGVALVVVAYLPLIMYELGHGFAETRGVVGYFTGPGSDPARDPVTRVLFGALRILAWPLTRWPIVDRVAGFLPAVFAAVLLAYAMGRLGIAKRARADAGAVSAATSSQAGGEATTSIEAAAQQSGARFVGGLLLLLILALGLGLGAVSQVQTLPTEQYHVVADPLVLVAAGLAIGALWRARTRGGSVVVGRAAAAIAVAALVAWNAGHWPPAASPDGGWPAAQAAATRLETRAGGAPLALVPLFAEKGPDAYLYPLTRDGIALVAPEEATYIAVLCDTFWLQGCGGAAEEAWRAANSGASTLTQVDRFNAAPDRILTVYRRGP
jgi:4-amino-4-deoxy-L-arabinose transferase-like glycosyltransferase